MRRFIHDTQGNASLWAVFIAIILCMLSVVAYTAATLYSTYQTAQTELERATNISVDASLANANVRDLLLDIPAIDSTEMVFKNLVQAGYEQDSNGDWERMESGKVLYSLRNLQISVSGEVLAISAAVSMPLPWAVGVLSSVDISIHVESRVLYLD
jgi:hypothetical protein